MSTASAASVQLKVGPPTALSPEDFIMGSAGNWQTENGIVMNAEERCVCVCACACACVCVCVCVCVRVSHIPFSQSFPRTILTDSRGKQGGGDVASRDALWHR